ncbi:MAG: hypothetical protein FWH34_08380 [Desulfovibrionaceae bacterium]|nr:hypothetical protein [Desulfovibrionaceae bacterium]
MTKPKRILISLGRGIACGEQKIRGGDFGGVESFNGKPGVGSAMPSMQRFF